MHNLEHRGDIETIEASSTTTVEYCGDFIDVQNIIWQTSELFEDKDNLIPIPMSWPKSNNFSSEDNNFYHL